MSEYRVVWIVDVDAESVEDAAKQAQRMQRDPMSLATCFEVGPRCACGEFHVEDLEAIDLMEMTHAH